MIRTPISYGLLIVSTAISAACAKNQTANANASLEPAPGMPVHQTMGPGMMGMGGQCPMAVPGTTVQSTTTSDGMSMTFTTTGDVADLGKRVRGMADDMNEQSSGAKGMHGTTVAGADGGPGMMMGGGGMGSGMHGMMGADSGFGTMMGGRMPPVHAQVDDVEGGARLRLTPLDPSKLGEMKEYVPQHVRMMNQAHRCSMMGAGE